LRNRLGRARAIALLIAYRLIEQGMAAGDNGVGLLQRQRNALRGRYRTEYRHGAPVDCPAP